MNNKERLEKLNELSKYDSPEDILELSYQGKESYPPPAHLTDWLLEDALKRLPSVRRALEKMQAHADWLREKEESYARECTLNCKLDIQDALIYERFDPVFLTIPEIVERTGFHRSYIYAEIEAGRLQKETIDGKPMVNTLIFYQWMQNPARGKRRGKLAE